MAAVILLLMMKGKTSADFWEYSLRMQIVLGSILILILLTYVVLKLIDSKKPSHKR